MIIVVQLQYNCQLAGLIYAYIPKIIGIARRRQINDKLVWNQSEQPEAGL